MNKKEITENGRNRLIAAEQQQCVGKKICRCQGVACVKFRDIFS